MKIIKHKGKPYLVIGDKAVLIDHFDEQGKPVINEVWSEETRNAQGGMDCTVHVPCLSIIATPQKPG